MKVITYLFYCGLFMIQQVNAQTHLDNYIKLGLDSNQSIKQQDYRLQKNMYALEEAKSLFLPNLSFNADYTKAAGGRTIDLPLGDLLNNAYSTLNKLTNSSSFPQLNNQHVLLNPDNYYDVRFHTTAPLLNAELTYNKKIKGQQVDIQSLETVIFKRELVKEIKKAYYQYAKASNAVGIYESAVSLVLENKRINTALYNNQKVNRTAVIRSENELVKINGELYAARQTRESAKAYFNFLINRPLRDSILLDAVSELPGQKNPMAGAVASREELKQLQIAADLNKNITSLNKSYIIPKIGAFLVLGSQALNWKVNNSSAYYFSGISLKWDLLAFGKNTFKIKESIAEQKVIDAETDYTEKQLKTQLDIANNDYLSAVSNYHSSQSQLQTANQYYLDELKLYKEGQLLYIELLDAQTQFINAKLQINITLYEAWERYAAIERANASFNLK